MGIWNLIKKEIERQNKTINLIASENYASPTVLKAMGTPLSNKYSEGYPGKRYYAGNAIIDEIESQAIELAKKLFNVKFANVQPHAGAIANFSAYLALAQPGEKIMGLTLSSGGHLTHGSTVNYSGKIWQSVFYELNPETEMLDYEIIRKQALEEKPKIIIAGYSAYSRLIDWKMFREIADEIDAYLLADISHIAGLIAAGLHPSPAGIADVITSTTHKTLRGPRGAIILADDEELAKKINKAVFPGTQGGPMDHVIAAKAVCFEEALRPEFKEYAKQIIKNAKAMAKTATELGYRVVSGGTDNHLFLLDLTPLGINGREAQLKLEKVGIILNMNAIPFDKNPPSRPSGIRIGTPAITTRGFKEKEAEEVMELIDDVLREKDIEKVVKRVKELAEAYPIYNPEDFGI